MVEIVRNPPPHGVEAVLKEFASLSKRYAAIGDLVVFVLDTDGLDGTRGRSDRRAVLEARRQDLPDEVGVKVLVILARQEVEVWAMWGAKNRISDGWSSVRAERDPKDVYWSALVDRADAAVPGKGRQRLVEETLALGWPSVCEGCPELADTTVATGTRRPRSVGTPPTGRGRR